MVSLKKIFLLTVFVLGVVVLYGQSAEEMASQTYVQNSTATVSNATVKGDSYYIFNGIRYVPQNNVIAWVGSTAVMNSFDGSFQVIFKSMPTKSKKYIVKPYGTFYKDGNEGEASIALLTDSYDTQFWSVVPNSGKIEVKIKGNKVVVIVKNVKICVSESSNCKNITGQIILDKE